MTCCICQNPWAWTAQRVNPYVILDHKLIIMYHNRFINCTRCMTARQGVSNRGHWGEAGREGV